MTSLDSNNSDKKSIVSEESKDQNLSTALVGKQEGEELSSLDSDNTVNEVKPTLYNDVEVDVSHGDQSDEHLDFTVEELTVNTLTSDPFSADTISIAGDEVSGIAMHADVKMDDVRQEPVMLDKVVAETDHFTVADSQEDVEHEEADFSAVPAPTSPVKPVKGSKLGMGWFQGFNLFICGLVFIGLAIFAYFMFGESPLYNGKLPKYVVVQTEDSASMGVLNPSIPLEERELYIYVPKVERGDDLEAPVLDTAGDVKTVTKVELLSDGSVESEQIIASDSQKEDEDLSEVMESPAFELLSADHNQKGLSEGDIEMVNLFNQQAGYAFMQGNYVGVNLNDAYYYYQEALKIDPESAPALNGLISIADIYYRSAVDTYNQGSMDIAQQYLAIGLKVLPDYAPLLQLQAKMAQNPVMQTQDSYPNPYQSNEQNSFDNYAPTDGFQFE